MNKRLLIGLLLLFAVDCQAAEDVALVKSVKGEPTVVHLGNSQTAVAGMKLFVSDRLVAGPGQTIGIIFNDGTTLSAGPSTQLDLRDYVFDPANSKFAFTMYLKKGTLVYSSGKLGKLAPSAVKLDTPRSSVGVRGTHLVMNFD